MENDCPDCYGKPPKKPAERCAACEYAESCTLYASMREEPAHARSHTCQEKALDLESSTPAGEHRDIRTTVTVSELAEFVKLLFRIDDYTLLILREVIANGATTVSEVAKAIGVRRQALHAKVLNTIKKFPQLSEMFAALMPRLSIAKRRYLKNQTRKGKSKK